MSWLTPEVFYAILVGLAIVVIAVALITKNKYIIKQAHFLVHYAECLWADKTKAGVAKKDFVMNELIAYVPRWIPVPRSVIRKILDNLIDKIVDKMNKMLDELDQSGTEEDPEEPED